MNREEMMVECAVKALQNKMAKNVVSLHVGAATIITDYFVLATGSNKSQMDAMIDGVQEEMRNAGYELRTREGQAQGGWVLLDYGDVVVHIFDNEMRDFYALDSTWRDVDKKTWTD
ncbi:ribosome-associated protein [Lachnospiraceae bacterium NE2001]|nr:ribosome-associated protein [Lachnospiraceae bacterium NE2001]